MKVCIKCSESKDLASFGKNKNTGDGLQRWCKACRRIVEAAYRKQNREAVRAGSRDYYAANKEKVAARKALHYKQNREVMLARDRDYYAANIEKETARQAVWSKANKGKVCASSARRRALKNAATSGPDPRVDSLYAIATWLRSKGDDVHVDHIKPLSKGGSHVYDNLQILTATENLRKGAKWDG